MVKQKNKYSKKTIALIDSLMGVVAVIHPLTATPQVYEIYSTQNVTGVSLLTWFGFMLLGFVFLAYGIVHNLKPIILTQTLWFAVDFAIVIGVLLYR